MAFVKLDCGILNSTTWVDKDARDIFISALLMAEPREITEPVEQIKLQSLDKTGFSVPPGWYGFVPSSSLGIIRQAMIDQEAGMAALERLSLPEQESRTPDFEGRRMVRVDGGFIILNYQKYRDKDHTAAERQRRYRERQRQLHRDATLCDRNITQEEAEEEAEAYNKDQNNNVDAKASTCPFSKIVDLYHRVLPELPKVAKITKKRQGYIRQRWREDLPTLDNWENFFEHVRQSKFLMGKTEGFNGRPPFRADLEWLTNPTNFTKIAENKYHVR